MKNIVLISLICAFALAFRPARAQTASTNSVIAGFNNIANEASSWLTTPDTNNITLETAKFRVETGPAVQSGVTVSDNVFLQYNFALSNRLALVSETRNASIAGTIMAEEIGIGYNIYQKYDTEVTAFAIGGYRFDSQDMVASIGAKIRHMVNKSVYIAPGIQLDFHKTTQPMITAEAGIAF